MTGGHGAEYLSSHFSPALAESFSHLQHTVATINEFLSKIKSLTSSELPIAAMKMIRMGASLQLAVRHSIDRCAEDVDQLVADQNRLLDRHRKLKQKTLPQQPPTDTAVPISSVDSEIESKNLQIVTYGILWSLTKSVNASAAYLFLNDSRTNDLRLALCVETGADYSHRNPNSAEPPTQQIGKAVIQTGVAANIHNSSATSATTHLGYNSASSHTQSVMCFPVRSVGSTGAPVTHGCIQLINKRDGTFNEMDEIQLHDATSLISTLLVEYGQSVVFERGDASPTSSSGNNHMHELGVHLLLTVYNPTAASLYQPEFARTRLFAHHNSEDSKLWQSSALPKHVYRCKKFGFSRAAFKGQPDELDDHEREDGSLVYEGNLYVSRNEMRNNLTEIQRANHITEIHQLCANLDSCLTENHKRLEDSQHRSISTQKKLERAHERNKELEGQLHIITQYVPVDQQTKLLNVLYSNTSPLEHVAEETHNIQRMLEEATKGVTKHVENTDANDWPDGGSQQPSTSTADKESELIPNSRSGLDWLVQQRKQQQQNADDQEEQHTSNYLEKETNHSKQPNPTASSFMTDTTTKASESKVSHNNYYRSSTHTRPPYMRNNQKKRPSKSPSSTVDLRDLRGLRNPSDDSRSDPLSPATANTGILSVNSPNTAAGLNNSSKLSPSNLIDDTSPSQSVSAKFDMYSAGFSKTLNRLLRQVHVDETDAARASAHEMAKSISTPTHAATGQQESYHTIFSPAYGNIRIPKSSLTHPTMGLSSNNEAAAHRPVKYQDILFTAGLGVAPTHQPTPPSDILVESTSKVRTVRWNGKAKPVNIKFNNTK